MVMVELYPPAGSIMVRVMAALVPDSQRYGLTTTQKMTYLEHVNKELELGAVLWHVCLVYQ